MTLRAHLADRPIRGPMTLDEWAAMPDDESGELVAGELVEEEMPDCVHEVVVIWLGAVFRAWIRPKGGVVGASGVKFVIDRAQGRKPDVFVYFPGHRPPPRGLISVPPDIVVEVVSPCPRDSRRDRVHKFDEYARFG